MIAKRLWFLIAWGLAVVLSSLLPAQQIPKPLPPFGKTAEIFFDARQAQLEKKHQQRDRVLNSLWSRSLGSETSDTKSMAQYVERFNAKLNYGNGKFKELVAPIEQTKEDEPRILPPLSLDRVQIQSLQSAFCISTKAQQLEPVTKGAATIVVLPDTERYSDDYPQYFEAQTKWIAKNKKQRNIVYTFHLGDITQRNATNEWKVAKRCFKMLDDQKVPYVLLPGNHDYDNNEPNRKTSKLSKYFPVSDFKSWPTYGGVFQEDVLDNNFHLIEIDGTKWIVVALEFGPRDDVVKWADKVLEKHKDRLAIVVTHAYLFRNNMRYDQKLGKQRASPYKWGNDGEQLWQKLIRKHPNLMIVLSGHVSTGGLGYLKSTGDFGNDVHQMMVDYEKMKGGGMAYLRLLEFEPDQKTIKVQTFSPALNKTKESRLEKFQFTLKRATRKQE